MHACTRLVPYALLSCCCEGASSHAGTGEAAPGAAARGSASWHAAVHPRALGRPTAGPWPRAGGAA